MGRGASVLPIYGVLGVSRPLDDVVFGAVGPFRGGFRWQISDIGPIAAVFQLVFPPAT